MKPERIQELRRLLANIKKDLKRIEEILQEADS